MLRLDILTLFVFVLSIIYLLNVLLKVVKLVFSNEPKQITFSMWEKISNYFFLSYLITYILT